MDFSWTCSGRIDCIHFMKLILKLFSYNTSRCFIVYTLLEESLLYTDNGVTVFINTIMNGNYIKKIKSKMSLY